MWGKSPAAFRTMGVCGSASRDALSTTRSRLDARYIRQNQTTTTWRFAATRVRASIRTLRQAGPRDTPCARQTAAGWKSRDAAPSPMPATEPDSSPRRSAASPPPTHRCRRPVSTISRRVTWRLSVRISIPAVSYTAAVPARRLSSDAYFDVHFENPALRNQNRLATIGARFGARN